MAAMNNFMEEAGDTDLVGMGLRVTVSPAQTAFYIILVLLGILGNATVVGVIGKSVLKDRGGGRNSDIIIINMALSNLLVSLVRNTLLVISDTGLEVCGLLEQSFLRLPISPLLVSSKGMLIRLDCTACLYKSVDF